MLVKGKDPSSQQESASAKSHDSLPKEVIDDFNYPAIKLEHYRSDQGHLDLEMDSLFLNLRPFLIFGKVIFVIPIQGIFGYESNKLQLRKISFPTVASAFVVVLLITNCIVGFIRMTKEVATNPGSYAWVPSEFIFHSTGAFVYIYFYLSSNSLLKLFHSWHKMNQSLTFTENGKSLGWKTNLVAGIILASGISENAVWTVIQFLDEKADVDVTPSSHHAETKNATALERYFTRAHEMWADLVPYPYHPIVAIFCFIANKLTVYAWNFMDLTIALLARAMYFKFKALYTTSLRKLTGPDGFGSGDVDFWIDLVRNYKILRSMLAEMEAFLSPCIFVSFGINLYYICLQLNLGLTARSDCTNSVPLHATWAFLQLVVRLYVILLYGARINDWGHRITDVFQKCPTASYTTEVERAERFLSASTIGLTGQGCFILTKSLILQIIGVIFTFEIVLLQTTQQIPPGNVVGTGAGSQSCKS